MFRIALNAGHDRYTPGRRIPASFDAFETREWVLNDRICSRVEQKLKKYTGYELLRVDDKTGQNGISLSTRAKRANQFGADFYLSVHHNAGVYGGSGGGIMTFVHPMAQESTQKAQRIFYEALIRYTGLIGNRANPLSRADFAELRLTDMPAVLLECGFMDSSADSAIIKTTAFAEAAAEAITESLARIGRLPKNTAEQAVPGKNSL